MPGLLETLADRTRAATSPGGKLAALAPVRRAAGALVTYRETYIWFERELSAPPPAPSRQDEFELVAVTDAELDEFHQLGSTTVDQTRGYREHGGQPWLARLGGAAAFACWIHPRETPLSALRSGFMSLPAGTACLEDSVTAPAFRGRGVAPRAWEALAARYRDDGLRSLVTKVLDSNHPSCKAVGKAGFTEVARMHVRQNGPWVRLRAEATADAGSGPLLVERLDGAFGRVR